MNLSTATTRSGSYPANSAALTRPPKNASSAAAVAAATCLYTRDSLVSNAVSQKLVAATSTTESTKVSKAPPPPPPPSQHMPQQYARHFPMLPNSNVQPVPLGGSSIGADQPSAYFTSNSTPLEIPAQRFHEEESATRSMVSSSSNNTFFPMSTLQHRTRSVSTPLVHFNDVETSQVATHNTNLVLASVAEKDFFSSKTNPQHCSSSGSQNRTNNHENYSQGYNQNTHQNHSHVKTSEYKEPNEYWESNSPISTSSVSPFSKQPTFSIIPNTEARDDRLQPLQFYTKTAQFTNSYSDPSKIRRLVHTTAPQTVIPSISSQPDYQPETANLEKESHIYDSCPATHQNNYEKPSSLNYLEQHYANPPTHHLQVLNSAYATLSEGGRETEVTTIHSSEKASTQQYSPAQGQGLDNHYHTMLGASLYEAQQNHHHFLPLTSVCSEATNVLKHKATSNSANNNDELLIHHPSRPSESLMAKDAREQLLLLQNQGIGEQKSPKDIGNNVQSAGRQTQYDNSSNNKVSHNNAETMGQLTGSSVSLPVTRYVDDAQSEEEKGESSDSERDDTSRLQNDALALLPEECKLRIRAVISGWRAGTIIGRQGAVINALRQDSNCRITMSDDPTSPDRTLSILGHPYEVANVLDRVCYLLKTPSVRQQKSGELREEATNVTSPTYSLVAVAGGSTGATYGSNINFTLAVPSPLCGCLIGRKGAQIREFRQRFNVSFSVSATPIQESNDRPVVVSGTPKNVSLCLREVCLLLAQTPRVQRETQEECQKPEDSGSGGLFQNSWKRAVSNAGGVYVHGQSGDERMTTHVDEEERHEVSAPSLGGRSQHRRPRHGGSLPGSSKGSRRGVPRVSNYRGGGTTSGEENSSLNYAFHDNEEKLVGNSICEYSFSLSNGETEVHLLVPNDIVGCIIGRAGKTISGIREASGAYISITDGTFPPRTPINAINTITSPQSIQRSSSSRGTQRDRVILIRGGSANVRHARYMMGSSILNAQSGGRNPSLSPATSIADFTRT